MFSFSDCFIQKHQHWHYELKKIKNSPVSFIQQVFAREILKGQMKIKDKF